VFDALRLLRSFLDTAAPCRRWCPPTSVPLR